MLQVQRHPRNNTVNRIVIENKRLVFDIELRGFVTVFEGDSSTGKTFLFNNIRVDFNALDANGKKQTGISEVVLVNDVLASVETVMGQLKNKSKALIMVDAASSILAGRTAIVDYISKDRKNQYLIAARGGLGLDVSLNHICELFEDGSGGKPRIANKFVMTKPTRK